MAADPETSTTLILQAIRSSGLNFCCQETPYSVHLTLRKSFTKSWSSQTKPESGVKVEREPSAEMESLRKEKNQFRDAFERVRQDLVDTLEDCEEKSKVIKNLQEINIKQEQTIKLVESKNTNLKKISDEKHLAKIDEIKLLKRENSELRDNIKEKNNENKSLVKEKKDFEDQSRKKLNEMESKLEHLEDFKASKLVEEKADKKEIKDLHKKLKSVEIKEAKLKLEVTDLERKAEKLLVKTDLKSSQTEHHPEIPYKVTTALPPIFSSQLCYSTPPIPFLSRSLPGLKR